MSPFPFLQPLVLELILSRLIPWFLEVAAGDIRAARDAAIAMLQSFDPQTEEEATLAAELIGFRLGSLEALSKSLEAGLSVSAVLRIRGNANTLNRSAHRTQAALQARKKQRGMQPPAAPSEASDAETVSRPSAAPLSRQQRRAQARMAEKAQRRQQERDRKAALLAARHPSAAAPMAAAHTAAGYVPVVRVPFAQMPAAPMPSLPESAVA